MGDYKISDIYQGGYDSLDPNKGAYFTGFHAKASDIGTSINPQTANQLGEINRILNQGFVPVEMGSMSGQIFDSIPKQHFKELGRVAKLTGSKVSLHAPIQDIEASGITQEGWSEENRLAVERQLRDVVKKSFDLDYNGGVPITVHSTGGVPGTIYEMENGKKVKQSMAIFNQETNRMQNVQRETEYYSLQHAGENKPMTPEKRLESANASEWDNTLSQIGMQRKTADEILKDASAVLAPLITEKENKVITPEQKEAIERVNRAKIFIDDAYLQLNSAFNKAKKYRQDDDSKEILKGIAKEWGDYMKRTEKESKSGELNPLSADMERVQLIDKSLMQLSQLQAPNVWVPVEDFAMNKSAQTFANVALESYAIAKKMGKDPSKICIENMYPGMAFADAESMNKLVKSSRDNFVKTAVEKGFMSESEAKKKSEEIIGVTFDLGHANISKKYGFTDKDIIKEAEAIAKNVKHVHLADNFGYNDSHLPPGMGNVANKEILEKLEKGGFKGSKIVEAGGFINQFKESPFMYSLEGLGAPMYKSGGKSYWNTSYGLTQGYFGGYGSMLPQQNYSMFGAGFSMLPQELGGSVRGGGNSRMGGNPLE